MPKTLCHSRLPFSFFCVCVAFPLASLAQENNTTLRQQADAPEKFAPPVVRSFNDNPASTSDSNPSGSGFSRSGFYQREQRRGTNNAAPSNLQIGDQSTASQASGNDFRHSPNENPRNRTVDNDLRNQSLDSRGRQPEFSTRNNGLSPKLDSRPQPKFDNLPMTRDRNAPSVLQSHSAPSTNRPQSIPENRGGLQITGTTESNNGMLGNISSPRSPIRDPALQRASHTGNGPTTYLNSPPPIERFLSQVDINQTTGVLPGQPVGLKEMLGTNASQYYPQMVDTYWRAFESWANQKAAQTELAQIQSLRQQGQADSTLLQNALVLSEARVQEAEQELRDAQRRLARFTPQLQQGILPIPSDLPLATAYRTNYDRMASRGGMSQRLQEINYQLPKIFELIQLRATQHDRCQQSAQNAVRAFQQGGANLASTLEAIRMCRESHHELNRSLRRYNSHIGEYALSVVPFGYSPEVLVGMLIKKPRVESQIGGASEPVALGQSVQPLRQASNFPDSGTVSPSQWQSNPSPTNSQFAPRSSSQFSAPPTNNGSNFRY